jgi:catechol 2,3-dioxygenase-like lactoylglutathione lyase family enzyme
MKTLKQMFLLVLLIVPVFIAAQNEKEALSPVKFEHLRINVADKEATAKWYVDHVGLEIIRSSNKEVVYVADKDHNFMLELSSIPNLKNSYFDIHIDAFHMAFEGHKTIAAVAQKMLANKGTQEGVLYQNKIGDYVMNVRDPNGFTSQLIHRVNPFFAKPVKSTIRFEHVAYNTPDQKIAALWYVEFMDLNVPWSKDIDTTKNNYRNYRVPYVGDAGRNMSLELFGKPEVPMALSQMKHDEIHIAYTTNEPEKLARRMVYGGAKIVSPARRETNGDMIIDMVDPYNFPVRLIKRTNLILEK